MAMWEAKVGRYLMRNNGTLVEVFDATTGKTVFGPSAYSAATRWAANRNSGRQPLRPERLALGGALDLQTPIRRPRQRRRQLIEAAAGVLIIVSLTYLALVALP